MTRPVTIVPYNPQWPTLYEVEKKLILSVLVDKVEAIEHAGSTAVPGLGGKDIVDFVVGVKGREDADGCVQML